MTDHEEMFFVNLANRMTRENNVSDVLYAALWIPEFYSAFADLAGLRETLRSIRREYSCDEGRPDLLIETVLGSRVLIEVKLFDKNYHYDEFNRIPNDRIILVSAHKPPPLPRWTYISWKDMIEAAEELDHPFALALCKYFRRVTVTEDLEPISIGRPVGMLYLNRALERVIDDIDDYDSERPRAGGISTTATTSEGSGPATITN